MSLRMGELFAGSKESPTGVHIGDTLTDIAWKKPGITRNEALKALGNGVVPQQCAAALRTMLAWEAVA